MDPITIALVIAGAAGLGARALNKSADADQRRLDENNKALVLSRDLEAKEQKEHDRVWERERQHALELEEARSQARHKQDIRIKVQVGTLQVIMAEADRLGILDDHLKQKVKNALSQRFKGDIDKTWKGW